MKRRRSVVARILPPPRQTEGALPDFLARLRRQFGTKMTPDSSTLFDEMRGEQGTLQRPALDWGSAWSATERLSHRCAHETLCRTLDTLHVAVD